MDRILKTDDNRTVTKGVMKHQVEYNVKRVTIENRKQHSGRPKAVKSMTLAQDGNSKLVKTS